MWKRILCDWFGGHDWTFTIILTRDGRSYSGRECKRCGAAQRVVIRSRRVFWVDADEEACHDDE